MNKSAHTVTRYKWQRWLLVTALAGLLVTTTFYIPALTIPVHACQHAGGGGC